MLKTHSNSEFADSDSNSVETNFRIQFRFSFRFLISEFRLDKKIRISGSNRNVLEYIAMLLCAIRMKDMGLNLYLRGFNVFLQSKERGMTRTANSNYTGNLFQETIFKNDELI